MNKSNQPEITLTKAEYSSLAVFGALVGMMNALTTSTGITATIVGLIFSMAGGSFLIFFKSKEKGEKKKGKEDADGDSESYKPLTRQQRQDFLVMVRTLCLGIFLGLFLGFGLRRFDVMSATPKTNNTSAPAQNPNTIVLKVSGAGNAKDSKPSLFELFGNASVEKQERFMSLLAGYQVGPALEFHKSLSKNQQPKDLENFRKWYEQNKDKTSDEFEDLFEKLFPLTAP